MEHSCFVSLSFPFRLKSLFPDYNFGVPYISVSLAPYLSRIPKTNKEIKEGKNPIAFEFLPLKKP